MSDPIPRVEAEGGGSPPAEQIPKKSVVSNGHKFSMDKRQVGGLILLVLAVAAIVFACILASGVFGGGEKGYIAAGLAVASIIFGAGAAYLLIRKHDSSNTLRIRGPDGTIEKEILPRS